MKDSSLPLCSNIYKIVKYFHIHTSLILMKDVYTSFILGLFLVTPLLLIHKLASGFSRQQGGIVVAGPGKSNISYIHKVSLVSSSFSF